MPDSPPLIPCVGAVIRDEQGRFLLVQRAHDPGRGLWSLPGGRVEPGESDAQALRREVAEEVGLDVRVGGLAGEVRRPGPAGAVFVIRDYLCSVTTGAPTPGTDALDARFAAPGDVPVTPGLWAALAAWALLRPRAGSGPAAFSPRPAPAGPAVHRRGPRRRTAWAP